MQSVPLGMLVLLHPVGARTTCLGHWQPCYPVAFNIDLSVSEAQDGNLVLQLVQVAADVKAARKWRDKAQHDLAERTARVGLCLIWAAFNVGVFAAVGSAASTFVQYSGV